MEKSRREFLRNFLQGAAAITAIAMVQPSMAQHKQNDFDVFMQFSVVITEEENLNKEFAELCWRYVQQHSKPEHIEAMHRYVSETDPTIREQSLIKDVALKSIAYHTLLVWYKGDVTALNPTKDEIKLAYLNALKWRVIGIPARGVCNPNWSKVCST